MKQTAKQLCLGLFPLAVGTVYNYAFLILPVSMIPVNVVYLAFWGYLCYRFAVSEQNPLTQTFRMCVTGLLMLAMVLYQELVRQAYFPGFLGLVGQFYFLPGMSVFGIFVTPFLEVIRPWPFFIAEYIGMCLICLAACLIKTRKACR